MREASRAGAAFCPEFCAKTKTDSPAKTQSEKISVEKQRIAFLEHARSRLVSADLIARKKRCKLNSNCCQFRGLSSDDSTRFAVSRGQGRKAA